MGIENYPINELINWLINELVNQKQQVKAIKLLNSWTNKTIK